MKNQFKSIFICLLTLLLVGCGIINTTVRGDSVARSNLNRVKSPCETIPRIYSGVFYDMCVTWKTVTSGVVAGVWSRINACGYRALSGVLDTVVLPYTIYEHVIAGSIELK